MAILSITASQVVTDLTVDADYEQGVAGQTIAAGDVVYLDSATQKYLLADADDLSATLADVRGIALNSASLNQPLRIQRTGRLTLGAGAAPVVGELYTLSATPGKIGPAADRDTDWHVTLIGVGSATNQIELSIWVTGQLSA